MAAVELCDCHHTAFVLPLGAELTAGGTVAVVTYLIRILAQIGAQFSVPREPVFNMRQVKMEMRFLVSI